MQHLAEAMQGRIRGGGGGGGGGDQDAQTPPLSSSMLNEYYMHIS